jgi:hypothetical protein
VRYSSDCRLFNVTVPSTDLATVFVRLSATVTSLEYSDASPEDLVARALQDIDEAAVRRRLGRTRARTRSRMGRPVGPHYRDRQREGTVRLYREVVSRERGVHCERDDNGIRRGSQPDLTARSSGPRARLRSQWCTKCSDKIDAFLGNLQFGLRKGGAEHIVHTIRELLERHPDFVAASTDCGNAFNSIDRIPIARILLCDDFNPLWSYWQLSYGEPTLLRVFHNNRSTFPAKSTSEETTGSRSTFGRV